METSAATIRIGGNLPKTQLDGLLLAIGQDGARLDWGEPIPGRRAIEHAVTPGAPLVLMDDSVAWGAFTAIEAFCQARGLTYQRQTDGDGETDAVIVFWAPGLATPHEVQADATGQPVVPLGQLQGSLAAGRTLAEVVALLEARRGTVPPFQIR